MEIKLIISIVVLVIFLIIIAYFLYTNRGVLIEVNGYKVRFLDYPDIKKAERLVKIVLTDINKLFDHLEDNYNPKIVKKEIYLGTELIYDKILRMKRNFKPSLIKEIKPRNIKGYTSYVMDKGESMGFCIRNLEKNIHEKNILMFVFIHEIAHSMTKSWGHPPIFWENMAFLLEQAEKIGIINIINYNKKPEDYCGLEVKENPLFV